MTYPAEPRCLERVLLLTVLSWWVPGELQHLRALLNPQSIALMPTKPTGVRLLYFVRFTAVHIPRLVTWRGVGKILVWLILLDQLVVPW
jgi:hypothetical protein